MRIERLHVAEAPDVATRAKTRHSGSAPDAGDSVNLRFAGEIDRTQSIHGDSYDPSPADIAEALIEKGFDR